MHIELIEPINFLSCEVFVCYGLFGDTYVHLYKIQKYFDILSICPFPVVFFREWNTVFKGTG